MLFVEESCFYHCSQKTVEWMKNNHTGYIWGNAHECIEPQENKLMAVLEPEDSSALISGPYKVILHHPQ